MPSVKCPICGQEFSPTGVADCPYCGTPLAPEEESELGFGPSAHMPPAFPPSPADADAMTDPMLSQLAPFDGAAGAGVSFLPWSRMRTLLKRSRPTRLEGTLVSVHTQQEEISPVNPLISLLALLKDLIWPSSDVYTGAQKKTITVIRVRTHSGGHRDARLDGEPRGALLVAGDNLSLWGRYWRGVFIVRRGFNHTSEAEIYSNAPRTSLLAPLLVVVTLLIALLVLWHFWPWPHLPFWPHLPL